MLRQIRNLWLLRLLVLSFAMAGIAHSQPQPAAPHLIVQFERQGNGAANSTSTTFDTDKMRTDDTETLRQLIREADFFRLPAHLGTASSHPGQMRYHIIVYQLTPNYLDNDVIVESNQMPARVSPLITWLNQTAP